MRKTNDKSSHKSIQISVLHQNINRLANKTYKIETELQLRDQVDVLCLTEHWLQSNQILSTNILNYQLRAHCCRSSKTGGGSCIYVRPDIPCIERKEITDLSVESQFEVCAIECIGLELIIVCIYRPPSGDISLYLTMLYNLLSLNLIQNSNVIIIGDINIDLMTKCNNSKYLLNTLKQSGFRQLISEPTRITNNSKTCIDHAYSNVIKSNVKSISCYDMHVSDHLCINVIVDIQNKALVQNSHILKRTFTKQRTLHFIQCLDLYQWDKTLNKTSCPSKTIELVMNVIKHHFDINFPLKKHLVKKPVSKWANDTIRKLRKNIITFKHKLTTRTDGVGSRADLQRLETDYWAKLRQVRSNFINGCISNTRDDMSRSVWRVISAETCKNNKGNAIDVLVSKSAGDCVGARAAAAAALLNRYYIDTNINNTTPCTRTAIAYLSQYLPARCPLFRFEPFGLDEMEVACKKIKRKESKDINDMSTRIIDYLPPVVISLLLMLFNKCVHYGIYPEVFKQIKVQPVYKGKGEMHLPKHYRPISLIPVISKIFECLLSNRLMKHVTSNDLLNRQQYAYQPGRSTSDATRDVVTRVMAHLEDGRQVAAIFCDLSRAFEMIDHKLLLAKLSAYGFSGGFHDVIASFLSSRRQSTYVLDTKSDLEQIGSCAVPQGSVMGNNLFLLLVNDITTACVDPEFVMFADDTCLIVKADNIEALKFKLEHVMCQITKWFSANGMLLNVEKTNIIHFKLRKSNIPLNIVINNSSVPQVDTTRYLGFVIDSGLTWSPHIDYACDRLSSACYALSRLAPTLTSENLKKAYFGYFHSLLIQGVDLWATSAGRDRLFKLQKRALRIIDRKPTDHPAQELFRKHRILTLPCVFILSACKYVRCNLQNYKTYGERNKRPSRRQHLLVPPRRRLAKARAMLDVVGPNLYNCIPTNITNSPSDAIFTNKLKNMLIELACYNINEFLHRDRCTHR